MNTHSSKNKEVVWGVIATLVVLSFVGIIIVAKTHSFGTANIAAPSATIQAPAITQSDWVAGNKNAKVSVIEYGDFQCPACAAYQPTVHQMLSDYGDRIVFVFRNFPLSQHQNAWISAQAAEAAGLQGKYWEMNSVLYEKQTDWSELPSGDARNKINEYASSLSLDMNKFNQDINSDQVKHKVQSDLDGGTKAQIDHTPTFFINGTQIPNPSNYDDLKSAIDKALASPRP